MIIEWLKFQVASEFIPKFLAKDAEIWTTKLSQFTGFLAKEVWLDRQNPGEIVMVIRWQTAQDWKSIKPEILELIEQEFASQMGDTPYSIVETKEFQVTGN